MWSLVTVGTTACHAISNAPGHLRLFSRRAHAFNTAWVMPTRVRDLRYQGSPECPHAFLNIFIIVFVWATKSSSASRR